MKSNLYPTKYLLVVYTVLLLPAAGIRAQICQNPTDTIYGLNLTGVITPINVNNATIGANLDSLTDGWLPQNSNGIGFSSMNGRFYYFERSTTTISPLNPRQRFVYYDPATATVLARATPPFPNANKCRSGCMNTVGNGYYTIDPSASAGPMLYHFDVLANTWDTVTTVYKTPANVDVSATFSSLNSGDMAFDGSGNLWILCSNSSKYGLYKVSAPVPSTAVASVTVTQVIAPTTSTPTGFSITGLAFNATGDLYLSTGAGDNKLFRMSSAAGPLTLVGTLPKDAVASDLTSCAYPMFVLPASAWLGFDAVLKKGVELSWTSSEDATITGYRVEYSTDGEHWKTLATLAKTNFYDGVSATYHYTDGQYMPGNNFYRVAQLSGNGNAAFSSIRAINTATDRKVYIGPNPARDILYVYNYHNSNSKYLAQVFDDAGRLVQYAILQEGRQSVNIGSLQKGSYVLKLTSSSNQSVSSHHFLKW